MNLADVAKEAGISKGGLLHYFASKNAVIRIRAPGFPAERADDIDA
ncbi:TetR family transcriptional regulator [Mesorhizobium amorphae]